MRKILVAIALAIAGYLLIPVLGAEANTPAQFSFVGLPYDDAKSFYSELRDSVEKCNRVEVANLLHYPFATKVNGKVVSYKNTDEFLKNYSLVITGKVKDSLTNTSFEDLVLQPTGAMTKGGIVWIGGVRIQTKNGSYNAIRVIGINN